MGISFAIHAAILLAAVVVLPDPEQFKVEQQPSIPVDIVTMDELSKRQVTQKEAPEKKVEKPAPEKVAKIDKIEDKNSDKVKQAAKEPQAEAPEPKPEPKKAEPLPEPEPKKVEAKPEPAPLEELIKKTAEPEPVAEPEPQPEKKSANAAPVPKPREKPTPPKPVKQAEAPKKKAEFNPDKLAALLNKIDDERASPSNEDLSGQAIRDLINSQSGHDDRISASELDWLSQRIGQCWNMPAGVENARNLIVKVRIQMDIDGSVIGQPAVVNSSSDPRFAAAARSAVAAVLGCQPYDRLPAEKYAGWKDIILNFDPSKMLALN